MAVPKVKYILIVEDDPDQAEFLQEVLRQRFPRLDIHLVETEFEFRRQLDELAKKPPAVAIIDVILRWTDPVDPIPARPAEVVSGGFQKAGLRCEELLRRNQATARVPVILYTVTNGEFLDRELSAANQERSKRGLPPVKFLGKEPRPDSLLDAVRDRVVQRRRS